MSLKRYFKSYTKENDQEYSVEVDRNDDSFVCNVYGKFGDLEPIERTFTASGPDAEQRVQEWLVELDEEVRSMMEKNENGKDQKDQQETPVQEVLEVASPN